MNEEVWSQPDNLGRAIRDEWRRMPNARPPIVVSVSFGENWFATPGNPKVGKDGLRYGLKGMVVNKVIPHIEAQILTKPVVSRHLLGLSMGAYNAAQIAFQNQYTFSSVSLLCPALAMPVRRDSETDKELAKRLNAKPSYLKQMLDVTDAILQEGEVVERYSILSYAQDQMPSSNHFYISSGRSDEFGFYGPALELHQILDAKPTVQSTFVPIEGGHCTLDPATLATFILTGNGSGQSIF